VGCFPTTSGIDPGLSGRLYTPSLLPADSRHPNHLSAYGITRAIPATLQASSLVTFTYPGQLRQHRHQARIKKPIPLNVRRLIARQLLPAQAAGAPAGSLASWLERAIGGGGIAGVDTRAWCGACVTAAPSIGAISSDGSDPTALAGAGGAHEPVGWRASPAAR